MIADFIAAGLQSGCRLLRRPTIPETCGHDMEVPDIEVKGILRLSDFSSVGPTDSVKAAMILTPGAVISG